MLIRPDAATGCALAAAIVAETVRSRADAVLGLAAGRTPQLLYRDLVAMHHRGELSFATTTTFNLDEYVGLAADDPRSYRSFMNAHLFAETDIDPERTHVPDGSAPDLQRECRRYEAAIAAAGGIDLQLLGLGRNGHIGFNEPTGSLGSRTWVTTLSEQTRHDNSSVFGDLDSMPRHAITMGVGTILDARQIVLLAFGPAKARAVAAAIEGPVAAMCPASALQLHPRTTVIVDEPAAAALRHLDHHRWVEANQLPWQRVSDRADP